MKSYFKKHNINVTFEADDEAILKAGTVDYYTFSYYMTSCVTANIEESDDRVGGTCLAV